MVIYLLCGYDTNRLIDIENQIIVTDVIKLFDTVQVDRVIS